MVKVKALKAPTRTRSGNAVEEYSRALRVRLDMSRPDWARALGVNERTVARWEDEGNDPGGVATAVMLAIGHALDDGATLSDVRSLVGMGINAMLYTLLLRGPKLR